MEKILLAVGYRQLEDYLKKQLKNEFLFVGETTYRGGIVRAIGQKNPDIVIIRETLQGNENIMSIVYEIRSRFPKTRIIFIAGKREPGDVLLATLVNYGVYNILQGENIPANEIIALIRKANEYNDVKHFQPVPKLDETKNEMLFQAPEVIEKEIVREIYTERQSAPVPITEEENKDTFVEQEPVKEQNDTQVLPTKEPQLPQKKETKKVEEVTIRKEAFLSQERKEDVVSRKEEYVEINHEGKKSGIFSKIPVGKRDNEKAQKESSVISETHNPTTGQVSQKTKKIETVEPKVTTTTKQTGLFGGTFKTNTETTGQKIFTFIGGAPGVGTTSIAVNVAVSLAQTGKKVLFMEFNRNMPKVSYWYDLGHVDKGIDTCLKYLPAGKYEKVSEPIITSKELKKGNGSLIRNYKKLPDTLDFLLYSKNYVSDNSMDIDLSLSKELYLYLLFQKGYDIVVLDMPCDLKNQATINALVYSNQIYAVVTQDVSSTGYHLYQVNELRKKGIDIQSKIAYIINRYEKADLNVKDIQEWIGAEKIFSIPDFNKEFINANYSGIPVLLQTKNNAIKNAIEAISRNI